MTVWSEQYVVGNQELDHHHEHIVRLVNALESAAETGEGARTADLVSTHLLRYMSRHLDQEEHRMAENRYANLAAHQIEHERLRQRVRQMARDIDAGRLGVNEIRLFVAEWLEGHVRTSDRDFGDYLRRSQFARRDAQR